MGGSAAIKPCVANPPPAATAGSGTSLLPLQLGKKYRLQKYEDSSIHQNDQTSQKNSRGKLGKRTMTDTSLTEALPEGRPAEGTSPRVCHVPLCCPVRTFQSPNPDLTPRIETVHTTPYRPNASVCDGPLSLHLNKLRKSKREKK